MYKNHTQCRACIYARTGASGSKMSNSESLVPVFDLGIQPLANDFRRDGEEYSGYAPLKVLLCPRCGLAQLSVVVKPEILYRNYSYVTSPSKTMRDHFASMIRDIALETSGKNVLEIGSNDGRLLFLMRELGYSVQGVDPAANLSAIANAGGVTTHTGFFGESMARSLPKYDIIIARHVFCHVDDWHDFVMGLESVSHEETLIFIEAPYAKNTIKNCEFDQVYHEHLSYLNLESIRILLRGTRLKLHRFIEYPIHGGTIGVMLRHLDSKVPSPEIESDRLTVDDWKLFSEKASTQISELSSLVRGLSDSGKRIAGIGASAKSTVWINSCGFSRKQVSFIADSTPQKLYCTSPGSDIMIIDEGSIIRELPDYVIVFAWNYLPEVLEKFSLARSKGVKFIVPVPKISIVT